MNLQASPTVHLPQKHFRRRRLPAQQPRQIAGCIFKFTLPNGFSEARKNADALDAGVHIEQAGGQLAGLGVVFHDGGPDDGGQRPARFSSLFLISVMVRLDWFAPAR